MIKPGELYKTNYKLLWYSDYTKLGIVLPKDTILLCVEIRVKPGIVPEIVVLAEKYGLLTRNKNITNLSDLKRIKYNDKHV